MTLTLLPLSWFLTIEYKIILQDFIFCSLEIEMETNVMSFSYNADRLLNIKEGDWEEVLKHYKVTKQFEKESVNNILHWYNRQPHLPANQIGEEIILRFLARKGYSVEKVKELIDNYFTARARFPESLLNRDPYSEEVLRGFQNNNVITLPQRTSENHRVTLVRKGGKHWDILDALKVIIMVTEYRLRNDTTVGEHWVFDLTNATIADAAQFTPVVISKFAYYFLSCVGIKVKGIHYINIPSYGIPLINFLKKFLKPKLANRIHLYETFEDLYKTLPRNIFPKDLGGDELDTAVIIDSWNKTLQCDPWKTWFITEGDLTTDESKREIKTSGNDGSFGSAGSFRQIEID